MDRRTDCARCSPLLISDQVASHMSCYFACIMHNLSKTLGLLVQSHLAKRERKRGPGGKAVSLTIHHLPRPSARPSAFVRIAHFFLPIFLMTSPIGPARLERGAPIGRRRARHPHHRARVRPRPSVRPSAPFGGDFSSAALSDLR